MIKARQITSEESVEVIFERIAQLDKWMLHNPGLAIWADGKGFDLRYGGFNDGSITISLSDIIFFNTQDYVFCKLKIGLQ